MSARTFILSVLLAVMSFSIYINSLQGDFLVDDAPAVINKEYLHDYKAYFSKHFKIKPGILDELKRVFLWHISKSSPYSYHLFNVLVHAGCTVLFFVLCNLLFRNLALSFLSALIFAIHPIHTEAVSWISGGHYAFSALFFFAAMILYIKSQGSLLNLMLAMIFLGFCLFAGNAVATLPMMFICYDIFFREKTSEDKGLKRFRILVLFLISVISLSLMAIFFVNRNRYIHTIFYFRGLSYLIVITKALVYYLKILYLPVQRGLYHPFGYNTTEIAKVTPAFFGALAVIFISIFSFFKCRRNARPISFGIAWFFITYLPYSNIIPVCNIVSERYLYLPSAGFSIIMAYLFLKIWKIINENKRYKTILRAISIGALTLFLGSYATLTLKRNIEYSNIVTYWQTNINNFPDGYKAYNNLAGTFYVMGDREQAIAYCWVNLMINPGQPHVWCNLGKVYREKGELKMARDCYQEALKVDKGFLPAQQGLSEIEKSKKFK